MITCFIQAAEISSILISDGNSIFIIALIISKQPKERRRLNSAMLNYLFCFVHARKVSLVSISSSKCDALEGIYVGRHTPFFLPFLMIVWLWRMVAPLQTLLCLLCRSLFFAAFSRVLGRRYTAYSLVVAVLVVYCTVHRHGPTSSLFRPALNSLKSSRPSSHAQQIYS